MTLPYERTSSVIRTRDFLFRLSTPYGDGFKGVRREVREEARRLLRHYPSPFDLTHEGQWCKDTVDRYYAERDK